MANKLGHALRWRCRIGFFPGRVGRPCGKKNWQAQKIRAKRRFGGAASVICEAAFVQSNGSQTKLGEISERRCFLESVAVVCAPPQSTSRAEKEPILADRLGQVPRWHLHRGNLFCGVDPPGSEEPTSTNIPNEVPSWGSGLRW